MAIGLDEIIAQLERQMASINRALAALRELGGIPASGNAPRGPAKRRAGMTPEGKARLIAALKKRWAAKKAAATRKGAISVEGRKRLALAMKRRWALKRSAAQAKKRGGRKKAA